MAFFGSYKEILFVLLTLSIVYEGLALNLRGKDVRQSTTAVYGNDGPPVRAIDGNRNTACHTAKLFKQWWRIDLGAFYCLRKITIVNRIAQTNTAKRLEGARVRAGFSPHYADNTMIGNQVIADEATSGAQLEFDANPPVTARYVTVDLYRDDFLHFAEIMIDEINPSNSQDVLDFTFVANPVRLGSSGDNDSVIAAYKGPNNIAAVVSFGRQLTTGGTNTGLPPGSVVEGDPPTDCAMGGLYKFTETGGIDRTGVFYAEATAGSSTTRIQAIILQNNASTIRTRPHQRTKTVNIGDFVTIEMQDLTSSAGNYRWRHNYDMMTDWYGQLTPTISSVAVTDEGIYSCFINGLQYQQQHGFMRLIVRACPAGMWGSPCLYTCHRCYNGGICDDTTGACICPPGFSGDACQQFHGRDVFGQSGSHSCSGTNDPHNSACRGRLFCLPDPYGCSCAAGYTGLDCMQECPDGKYGADCKQTCHCALGVTCLKDTGECSGACDAQYSGGNCQCSAQNALLGLSVMADSAYQLTVTWLLDPCISGYTLQYALTNRGQCDEILSPQLVNVPSGDITMTTKSITGLVSHSTYSVYITPHYGNIQGPESTVSVTTPERDNPTSVAPLEVTAQDSTSVTLRWQEVSCAVHYRVQYGLFDRDSCDIINPPDYIEQCLCTDFTTFISGLYAHSRYIVYVHPYVGGAYLQLESMTVTTNMTVPTGPPADIQVTSTLKRQLTFSWSEPLCGSRGGAITGYNYRLVPVSPTSHSQVIKESTTTWTSVTISGLIPYTQYRFNISANTSVGAGPVGEASIMRTDEAVPTVPLKVEVQNSDDESITLEWDEPNPPQGIITQYNIRYDVVQPTDSSMDVRDVTALMHRIGILQANITYFIQVRAVTAVGPGPWSDAVNATTRIGFPGPVGNLRATSRTENSITLDWNPPTQPRGQIKYYIVEYKASSANDYKLMSGIQPPFTKDSLNPVTDYEFKVSAQNQLNKGKEASIIVFTKPQSNPPTPPAPISYDELATDTTVTIGLNTVTTGDDYIESYVIRVKKTSARKKRKVLMEDRHEDSPNDYIAAEMLKKETPNKFTVGDGKMHGGYYNAPLLMGSEYAIYVGAVSRGNESEGSVTYSLPITRTAQKPTSSAGLVAGLIIAFLVLAALVVFVVIYKRRRANQTKGHSDEMRNSSGLQLEQKTYISGADTKSTDIYINNDVVEVVCPPMPKSPKIPPKPSIIKVAVPPSEDGKKMFVPPKPIRIEDLAKYIRTKELEGDNGFKADYKSLPDEQLHPWTVAAKPENKQKNRYVNVIAYDHSRVVLELLDGDPNSDYINACYIDGYRAKDKFVASQGPNKGSLRDIWRMVWQLDVDKIIMLTNPIENGKTKCLQYWSDSGTATYADISVLVDREDSFLDYTIRDFSVHKVGLEGSRTIKQFHYTTWPDMKPPEYPAPLLNFLRLVNSHHNEGRTVVHCSAGVGRTGTFIALDSLLEQMAEEGQVDVLGYIYKMRQNRIKMVQTPEQYKFLYDAVHAAYVTGEASYHSAELRSKLGALKKKAKKSSESGLEKQFQSLSKLSMNNSMQSKKSGAEPENIDKNRFPGFLPSDRKRPFLMTRVNKDDSNYINATFLPSYRRRNQYITTQTPMPNTVADLWRLVYDHKVSNIVMLNNIDANDKTVCCYWPEDQERAEFGPLLVELTETKDSKSITERTFTLTNTKAQSEQCVTQYQYKDWPTDQEVPRLPNGLLALMERTADLPNDGRPILVHCIDGLGRSAVYCTLMAVLEQVKVENIVDVFQAVHRLRMANENMMYSKDHYAMCYDVIQAHLDSSNIYMNYTGND